MKKGKDKGKVKGNKETDRSEGEKTEAGAAL